ncbi:Putative transcriptional activator, SARP family OS=Streptomyces tendae OX=1932 GN=llpRIV PE=3 SV=1 [Streptomyces tendae]
MEFGLPGSLYVRVNGETSAPSAPKLRNVLAMLLVHAGQVVPVSSLVRDLWDDDPPVSGLTTLQTYILNLRKMFSAITGAPTGEVARDVLVTRAGGYSLVAEAGALDLHRYRRLVTSGREALARGDDAAGMRDLNEALLLGGVPPWSTYRPAGCWRAGAGSSRSPGWPPSSTSSTWSCGSACTGRCSPSWPPSRWRTRCTRGCTASTCGLFDLSGRRAQALQVFHRLRGALVAGLGLEPGPQVQRLHQAVLKADTDFKRASPRSGLGCGARHGLRRRAPLLTPRQSSLIAPRAAM